MSKKVVFDGKNLSFPVDGVEVINGKLPSSFEIKESYVIDRESLAKLAVAFNEKIEVLKTETSYSDVFVRHLNSSYTVFYRHQKMSEVMGEKTTIGEELSMLNYQLCNRDKEIDRLKLAIDRHNNSNLFSRILKSKIKL